MSECTKGSLEEPRVVSWQCSEPLPTIPQKNFATFMLEEMAKVSSDREGAVAMVDAETGEKRTYAELCELVPRVSAGLAAAGVGLGDRVMYYSLNHIDYPLLFLSVLHRGATFVKLSPVYDQLQEDLLRGVQISGAHWAIVHAELLDQAKAVFSLLPPNTLKKVWVIGNADGKQTLDDLAAHDPIPPVTQVDGFDPDSAVAEIPFSSGTTGPRKGVMISHSSEVSRMIMIRHLVNLQQWLHLSEYSTTSLVVTSFSHAYAHVFLFATFMFGGKVVTIPHFSEEAMLKAIMENQVTLAIFTPYHLKMLVESPVVQQYDMSSLKAITSAAAHLPESLVKSLKGKVDTSVYNMWGLTELCSIATSCLVTQEWKSLCIGKVVPFMELKVVDVNTGQMLGAGESGELCIRSPCSTLGYIDNPAATATLINAEGWVHTGDYGYYDSEDFVHLTNRIKDLIKTKMHQKVQPSELEALMLQHPHVAEAVVVGVVLEDLEELPRAFVVLKPDAVVQPQLLQQFVNERVPDFKQLTGGVWVVKNIPKNSLGKVLRQQLKATEVRPLAFC